MLSIQGLPVARPSRHKTGYIITATAPTHFMKSLLVSQTVIHPKNGFADPVEFIEIEGQKFQKGEGDQPKKDDKGNPIPFVDPAADPDKGKKAEADKINFAEADIEELAKHNPKVAAMLDEQRKKEEAQKDADEKARKKEQEALEKNGEWQKLAESRNTELETVKADHAKTKEQLGKYVDTVKEVLKNVMATIPADKQGLIPEDFSPRQKLEYIGKNAALLGASVVNGKGDPVKKGDPAPGLTDREKIQTEFNELQKKGSARTETDNSQMFQLGKKLKEFQIAEQLAKKAAATT